MEMLSEHLRDCFSSNDDDDDDDDDDDEDEKVYAGCGKWEPPMIKNIKYKGKWTPPLIANPLYIGKWAPRKIDNPNYYVEEHPYRFAPIAAVGFEMWTMTSDITIDNIYLGHDYKAAKTFGEETTIIKTKVQDAKLEAKRKVEETLNSDDEVSVFDYFDVYYLWSNIAEFSQERPLALVAVLVASLLPLLMCCGVFSSAKDEKETASEGENEKETEEHKEKEEKKEEKDGEKEKEEKDGGASSKQTKPSSAQKRHNKNKDQKADDVDDK